MRMKVLGIDIDSVVCELTPSVLIMSGGRFSRYQNNIPKDKREITDWNMSFKVMTDDGVLDVGLYDEIMKLFDYPGMIKSLPLVNDADHAIWFLKRKFKLLFVTSRPSKYSGDTQIWIKNKLNLKSNEFKLKHVEKDKNGVGADILIDDNIGNAYKFAENGKTAILFDQPWNKSLVIEKKKDLWPEFYNRSIVRMYDWYQITNNLISYECYYG